jgi:hypothetical protein
VQNTYVLKTYPSFPLLYERVLQADRILQFTSHDDHFPLPDKCILAAHAAISLILPLRGTGKEINKMLTDLKELRCLVEDVRPDLSSVIEWLVEVS